MSRQPPETCPACGADVPARARACPECGSDETTGWSERAHADNLGIPDDTFSYEEFVEREFGGQAPKRRLGWLWIAAALLLLTAFALALVRY